MLLWFVFEVGTYLRLICEAVLAHTVAAPHASFNGKTIGLLIFGYFTAVRTQRP